MRPISRGHVRNKDPARAFLLEPGTAALPIASQYVDKVERIDTIYRAGEEAGLGNK